MWHVTSKGTIRSEIQYWDTANRKCQKSKENNKKNNHVSCCNSKSISSNFINQVSFAAEIS